MEIYPLDNSDKLTGIVVEHAGERIVSEGSIYDRTPFPSTGELFMDINAFWATLPPATQETIWNCYKEIEEAFLTTYNDVRLHERIVQLVGRLYSCWRFSDLASWVRLHGRTLVPPEIQDQMGEYTNAGRTYLRQDYQGLICLVVALRPMIPIWNRYVRESKRTAGTHFKELAASGLLNQTEIVNTAEFEQLRTYVRLNIDASKITISAIVAGVGHADLEDWMFGMVLIRKVCVGVIMHSVPGGGLLSSYSGSTNIVSNIFRQIETTLASMDRKFEGRVRRKSDGMTLGDDDKESSAEKVSVKQQISDYKLILGNQYAKTIINGKDRIDPTLPTELIELCTEYLAKQLAFNPLDAQLTLTQWVVHPVLSARFVPALEQPERVNVMGLAQALYWHWGFYDLALLVTATPQGLADDAMFGTDTRSRVTTEQFKQLREQYPYYHRRAGTKPGDQQRSENIALIAIEKLYTALSGKPYHLDAPPELIAATTMRPYHAGGYLLGGDLKVQLAEFIIRLNNHKGALNNVN